MKATKEEVIYQLMIEYNLIDPISKILNKLNNNEFRDCDIKWLDAELEKYTKFACKTLGITALTPGDVKSAKGTVLNYYVINIYISRFKTLLAYFKTF